MIGLDFPEVGSLVQSRVSGALKAVRDALPDIPIEAFVRMDGRGMRDRSCKLITEFLNRHPKDRRIFIAAATDTSALGAVDAARALGRLKHTAVVGQDCVPEALEEMRKPGSPLIASPSHEVGTYGPNLIQLGLALGKGQTVPPYNYVTHRLVTRDSVAESAALLGCLRQRQRDSADGEAVRLLDAEVKARSSRCRRTPLEPWRSLWTDAGASL